MTEEQLKYIEAHPHRGDVQPLIAEILRLREILRRIVKLAEITEVSE